MNKTIEENKQKFYGVVREAWDDIPEPAIEEIWAYTQTLLKQQEQEIKLGEPLSTFIQWKGTDLCMDWYCRHGHQNHWDGDFAYEIPCETCGEMYKLDDRVKITYLKEDK